MYIVTLRVTAMLVIAVLAMVAITLALLLTLLLLTLLILAILFLAMLVITLLAMITIALTFPWADYDRSLFMEEWAGRLRIGGERSDNGPTFCEINGIYYLVFAVVDLGGIPFARHQSAAGVFR